MRSRPLAAALVSIVGVVPGPAGVLRADTAAAAPPGEAISESFSESFSGPAPAVGNRNGDLSSERFSVSRWRSETSLDGNQHVTGGPPLPGDARIVDGRAVIEVGSQNYGDTSVRIAQPFDIAGRTGTVRFDTSLYRPDGLWGWPTFYFLEDPYSAPSYSDDNSLGALPDEGLGVHFQWLCDGPMASTTAAVRTYHEHVETEHVDEAGRSSSCPDLNLVTAAERLNRVEVRVSTSRLEIWASDASSDGVTFGPLKEMWAGQVELSFSRGFVSFGGHNHATQKYGGPDSWTTYWDNISFDGPVLPATRVSQVANSGEITFGYELPNGDDGGATPELVLPDVVLTGASAARLVLDMGADQNTNRDFETWRLNYRFNGGNWHAVALVPEQYDTAGYSWSFPVALSELIAGTNTVQFSATGFSDGFAPYIGNIDLVIATT